MDHVHIGKAIAWGRRTAGLTKSQVAEHLACNRTWIYRLENGDNCPSFDFVESAARLFGMHNVEQLKCGLLPFRLAAMYSEEFAEIDRLVGHIPGGHQELELAKDGIRQPGQKVLSVLAGVLAQGSLEELLYGEMSEQPSVQLEAAKAG